MEKTKTKIKLIREVYQFNGELYEDLETCLSDVVLETRLGGLNERYTS